MVSFCGLKVKYRSLPDKKNPGIDPGTFRVTNGARTHDPQNHNLML